MSPWRGFREPIGPEPARTYWIRRGLVVLIAVLVIALIVWLLSSLAGGSARKGSADPAAASFTPNPSWSDTGWATPINTSASQSASPPHLIAARDVDPGHTQPDPDAHSLGTTMHGDDSELPGQGQGPQVCRWFCRGLHHHRHQ